MTPDSIAQRDRYGEIVFRFFFGSLYRFGQFSGDPHPGNYLFHEGGRITFLDFGLVKRFTHDEMATFVGMVKAAAFDHDAPAFRRVVEDAGMLRRGAPERPAVLAAGALELEDIRTKLGQQQAGDLDRLRNLLGTLLKNSKGVEIGRAHV